MPGEELDDLFEVEPAGFVQARDSLAKRLRQEGRADEARAVRRLRRPNAVVWGLNQVARRHPDDVEALLAAGEEVREAQRRRAGARIREAGDELQARVSRLAVKAGELIVERGVAASGNVPALETALRAAALGRDAAQDLHDGRLERVPEAPTGEEMWTAGSDVDTNERDEDGPVAQHLVEARERHDRAVADVDRARAHAARAERRLEETSARLDRERAAFEEARDDMKDAERRARETEAEVGRLAKRSGARQAE